MRDAHRVLGRRRLLTGTLGLAACGGNALPPVAALPQSGYDACPSAPPRTLSILTWNIFMMPPFISESPRNQPRAATIGEVILEHDFDILCFQKAFDAGARSILSSVLGARYSFAYGPANSGSILLNSGLWILSRTPLTQYREIAFNHRLNVESFSNKGAMLLSGTCGPKPFFLVTAHLQGEEGRHFPDAADQNVRNQQIEEIRDRLLLARAQPSVPIFICGDLGTPRFQPDGVHETDDYLRMLRTLDAENGAAPRITWNDSKAENLLATDDTGLKNELDYVLLRRNGSDVTVERTRYVFRRQGWEDPWPGRVDLSYHYALGARITF